MRRIAVIGGGAAGTLAAYAAAQGGARVVLFEKNEKLGKKLYITGKGRCNLTNACDIEDFFAQFPTHGKFLYSAFYTLPNTQLMALVEGAGCPLKVERGRRVFPVSDKSSDVLRALGRLLKESGVDVRLNTPVERILTENGCVCGVAAEGNRQRFDAVILATGGVSYPGTGSTGDGHRMARRLGHRVSELTPSLIPLLAEEQALCAALAGLSLRNVRLTLLEGGKKRFSEQGEMLFAHFGVTGPLVLSASAHLADRTFADTFVSIDLKPALSAQQLDARILRDLAAAGGRQLSNVLGGLFPGKLIGAVLQKADLAPQRVAGEVTREERARLLAVTKDFRLRVVGTRPIEEAIVTRGGVDVREVDPSTMQSKKLPGLYLTGELLDIDGYTGGFNLQTAFSTGYLAGLSAAEGN